MPSEQILALVLVVLSGLYVIRALRTAADAPPGTQADRFLGAVSLALVAVWLLMPGGTLAWWLALVPAAAAFGASLRSGYRLGVSRLRHFEAGRRADCRRAVTARFRGR